MNASQAAGFGLGQPLEHKIDGQLTALIGLIEQTTPVDDAIVGRTDKLLQCVRQVSGIADHDKDDGFVGQCDLSAFRGTAVLAEVDVEQAHQCWRHQQIVNARDALGVLRGDKDVLQQRVRSRLAQSIARPTALLEALAEIKKVSLLLTRQATPVQLCAAENIADDNDNPYNSPDNWLSFGEHTITPTASGFRLQNSDAEYRDAMMWTRDTFSDGHLVRLTLSANSAVGGIILAICGKPRPGKDLSESAKEGMEPYNHGIDAYHVSVHRVGSAMTNLRRPGRGLKMLASVCPDPCEVAGKSYEICIAKWENSLLFLVDGNLIHHYYDAGVYGPALQEGHLGIRHWRNTDVTYGDIQVHRLIAV